MSTVSVSVPKIYDALLRGDGKIIEHAAVDCRSLEVSLVLALSLDGTAVVCTRAVARADYLLREWFSGSKPTITTIDNAKRYVLNGSTLWVTSSAQVPTVIRNVDHLIIVDAHEFPTEPSCSIDYAFGHMAPRGHWFYALCRRTKDLLRITFDEAKEAFPSLEKPELSETESDRLLYLRDTVPGLAPFRVFAPKRLWVRSDKGPGFLSRAQQGDAQAALGPGWASGRYGVPIVRLEVSRMQRRYLALKRIARREGYRKFLLLKYRRGGFSTIEQGESYQIARTLPNSYCATLAHTEKSTSRFFRIMKTFQERDPQALPTINDSTTSIELSNGSLLFTSTAGAKGALRGDGLQRAHGSEVSRWFEGKHNQIELTRDLISAMVAAATNGEVVLETTPKGHEWFAATYKDAKRKLNDYFPVFLPWYVDPTNVAVEGTYSAEEIKDTLTEEEKEVIAKYDLCIAQLAFRRAMQKEHKHLFPQEFPEDDITCFITSGIPFFNVLECAARIETLKKKTVYTVQNNGHLPVSLHLPGGVKTVWQRPQSGVKYCAGVDTSEGIPGCDPNGIGIVRHDTGEQVAAIHGMFSTEKLAELAVDICHEYNDALMGVERQNHGHAVLQRVIRYSQDSGLKYHRPHDKGGRLYFFSEGKAGWSTDAITRPRMLDDLADIIDNHIGVINDELLLEECTTFKKQSNKRFEADPGTHDDCVIKWAIAYAMRNVRLITPRVSF